METQKEKVTLINHDQILAILKATMGKTPVKHFAEHLKVVSHQFLSKVLSGDYFIGPKLAKAIGYEQVVRFRPVKLSAKENDVLAAVEQLKAAGARPMSGEAIKKAADHASNSLARAVTKILRAKTPFVRIAHKAKPHHVPPVKAKPIKKAKAIKKKK